MNNSTVCTLSDVNNSTCFNCCSIFFEDPLQDSLDAPMPWIGVYIAIASVVLFFIIFYDFPFETHKVRPWSPSKYFRLNSLTLTLLAVATKISVDLSEKMTGTADEIVRITSPAFMLTAITNFTPCLGSMRNNEIMLNMVSLSILVITIDVNVWIRNARMSSIGGQEILVGEVVLTVFMTLSLVTLISLSISIPTLKKHIESEFEKVHRRTISDNQLEWGNFNIDELGRLVRRYLLMAETGNPEVVIARSPIRVIQCVMCLLSLIIVFRRGKLLKNMSSSSSYKVGSIFLIALSQMLFLLYSSILAVMGWLDAAIMKAKQIGNQSLKDKLVVETYWTQLLLDWKKSPLSSTTRRLMGKKLALNARKLLLNFCYGVQVVIVFTSKVLQLLSAKILSCIFCYSNGLQDPMPEDISRYVVLLEGEGELPRRFLSSIFNEKMIRTKQPRNLIKLLEKSVNFNGVRDFDSKQIQCLDDVCKPYYCWSLPIVTLASIALALPKVTTNNSDQLLGDVSKGLYFVKHIENSLYRDVSKSLDYEKISDNVLHKTGMLARIRDAVDVIWAGVELEHKWNDIDILAVRRSSGTYHDALQTLSDEAKKIMEGVREVDPKNWPPEVISANAMYRTSLTIVEAHRDNNSQTEDQLFERLSIMISDILCACLTNLPRVITLMCHITDIEEREESVLQAAVLLGESRDILSTLRERELPQLDAKKAAYLEEWRTFLEQDTGNPVASIPAETTTVSNSDGDHIIELGA